MLPSSQVSSIRYEEVSPGLKKDLDRSIKIPSPIAAKYKVEVIFSRHRSTLSHVASPLMLLIWESGKKLHGGGDQKMYWCGYDDCGKPLSSDNFGFMHVVCPSCRRECFLDPEGKQRHIASSRAEGRSTSGLESMPTVTGEKMARLTPPKLADLLVKTFHQLNGDVDIYLKYSPFEIRYDSLHEKTSDIDNLDRVRIQRNPLIYSLKNIIKDMSAGADLKKRFLAMITS